MSTYLARNGVTVSSETQNLSGYRRIKFEGEATGAAIDLSHDHMEALIECLDHETDVRLGRWRWPEHPQFLVYWDEDGDVTVFNEQTCRVSSPIVRDEFEPDFTYFSKAATAYYAAHAMASPAIPEDANYITWVNPRDGEHRIALRYGHRENKVWRMGTTNYSEDELIENFIGDATVYRLAIEETG